MADADPYLLSTETDSLQSGIAQVWRVRIAPPEGAPDDTPPDEALGRSLSDDERARAARFKFNKHRYRYVAARAALRRLLGRYAAVDPADLCFDYGLQGKPRIEQPTAARAISFNMSHSRDLALLAFTLGPRLGVDIEAVRNMPNALGIARRFFTVEEAELLAAAEEVSDCFFRFWTRKEAVIKAVGTGLATPLSDFDVSSGQPAGEPWRTLRVASLPDDLWAVHDLPAAPGYRAAICIEGAPLEIVCYREPEVDI
ncbi:MAG TPA: 4'-phosphopantetheinyl transferase superfamily protein [Pirellulales bacterium]|jgi:4'-phosphopantetheinyl transferase